MPRHTRDIEAACRRVTDQRNDDLTTAELLALHRVGQCWCYPEPITWADLTRAREIVAKWDAQQLPTPEPTTASG